MPYCLQCHREIDTTAGVCPYCQARQSVSKPAVQLREQLTSLASILSSLVLLISFFLPWFSPLYWPALLGANGAVQQHLDTRISLSGLDLTQQQFLAHEFYSPQTQPGDFVLLWVLPLTALLCLGAEIARVRQARAFGWLRFWVVLAVCASLVSLIYLFFNLHTLQINENADRKYGFWLTCASLILATLLGLRRRRYVSEFVRSRRTVLFTSLNFLALLGGGMVAASFFLSDQQNYVRARNTRAVFSTGVFTNFPLGKILAWSPNSRALLARTDYAFWDGGLPQPSISNFPWQHSDGMQFAMLPMRDMTAQVWSPDSGYLAMTLARQMQVYCWHMESGAVFRNYIVSGEDKVYLRGLAWSPDGKRIAAGVDGTNSLGKALYVWESVSGKQLSAYTLPFQVTARVRCVAWSPDGNALAACGVAGNETDKGNLKGFVVVWDLASSQVSFQHLSQVNDTDIVSLAWSPDSHLLAFADSTYKYGSALNGDLFEQFASGVPVQVWDVTTNRLTRNYAGHILGINCVGWSPNGKHLGAGGDDGTVQIWDITSGQRQLIYQGHQDHYAGGNEFSMVLDLAWSPDGKMIASVTSPEVRIWDAP